MPPDGPQDQADDDEQPTPSSFGSDVRVLDHAAAATLITLASAAPAADADGDVDMSQDEEGDPVIAADDDAMVGVANEQSHEPQPHSPPSDAATSSQDTSEHPAKRVKKKPDPRNATGRRASRSVKRKQKT
jgi:hypothetical protein